MSLQDFEKYVKDIANKHQAQYMRSIKNHTNIMYYIEIPNFKRGNFTQVYFNVHVLLESYMFQTPFNNHLKDIEVREVVATIQNIQSTPLTFALDTKEGESLFKRTLQKYSN